MKTISKIIVVYGPPCSGKSTQTHKLLKTNDVIFDFDSILQSISNQKSHQYNDNLLNLVVEVRNLIIQKVKEDDNLNNIYIIATKVTPKLLDELKSTDADFKFIDKTMEQCLEYLKNDKTRVDKDFWKKKIIDWFKWYEENPPPYQDKEVRALKIEVRADDIVHIEGYVNATEKKSRPVITPHGKCIEMVEERAFESAIERAGDVSVTIDHDKSHIYASTSDNTLKLYEDGIGLHADVLIKDKTVVELAKQGKIRGWSFGMYNVVDEMEQRADGELPIRHIKSLDLDHVTLVVNKVPCYSATSVEVRADNETDIEERAIDSKIDLSVAEATPKIDYSIYENRIGALKAG